MLIFRRIANCFGRGSHIHRGSGVLECVDVGADDFEPGDLVVVFGNVAVANTRVGRAIAPVAFLDNVGVIEQSVAAICTLAMSYV